MELTHVNLVVGWSGMLAGAVSGALIGLRFHRDEWLGGYASFPRRMIRLGHISLFGLGFLNVLFALTILAVPVPGMWARAASTGFVVAAVTMPACCALTAWKPEFRHLFPVPVLGVFAGVGAMLGGWLTS